jgi:hypothetical protein
VLHRPPSADSLSEVVAGDQRAGGDAQHHDREEQRRHAGGHVRSESARDQPFDSAAVVELPDDVGQQEQHGQTDDRGGEPDEHDVAAANDQRERGQEEESGAGDRAEGEADAVWEAEGALHDGEYPPMGGAFGGKSRPYSLNLRNNVPRNEAPRQD